MWHRLFLLSALGVCATGCSGRSYKVAEVSGQVTMDGKPLPHVIVTFIPITDENSRESPPPASGKTDGNGRYRLITLVDGIERKGAVVGNHKVRINATDEDDPKDGKPHLHKELPAKYNRVSQLTQDVPENGTDKADFPLTSK